MAKAEKAPVVVTITESTKPMTDEERQANLRRLAKTIVRCVKD